MADGHGLGGCRNHRRPRLRLGRDRGTTLPGIPSTPHDVFNTYLVAYEAAWRSFPDAEPCLAALRHVAQVAVLSNGDQGQQEEKVSRTGLGRYIDVVLTSDQLGVAKPDPRVFELACIRLGVPAHAAVYVGDQLEVDAVAASAAGLRGIWLNRMGGAVPPGVEAVDNLAELPSLLGDP